MNLFDKKNISPMLLESEKLPFNDKDYIYELKLDGIRCVAYLDSDKTILRNKRNKDVTSVYPELNNIHKQAKEKCIIDGELVVISKNGTPDFFALQKRSLLTDKFRIEIESEKTKVHFVAYDILFLKDKELINKPLLERKELLKKTIKENEFLSISRYIEEKGIELFNQTKKLNLEGIVAKKKDSVYELGKRSKNWIKIKNLLDEDFIVCGIKLDDNGKIENLILGDFDKQGNLQYRGKVNANISKEEKNLLLDFASINKIKKPLFEQLKDKDIIWINPNLTCTVQYMMLTKDGGMRQPVLKGLRFD